MNMAALISEVHCILSTIEHLRSSADNLMVVDAHGC